MLYYGQGGTVRLSRREGNRDRRIPPGLYVTMFAGCQEPEQYFHDDYAFRQGLMRGILLIYIKHNDPSLRERWKPPLAETVEEETARKRAYERLDELTEEIARRMGILHNTPKPICTYRDTALVEGFPVHFVPQVARGINQLANTHDNAITESEVVSVSALYKQTLWEHLTKLTAMRANSSFGCENLENGVTTTVENFNEAKAFFATATRYIDEVQRLIGVCESLRNRALVHILYESGGRISEILNLRLRDVEFDTHGAVIIVKGKTGMRRIRLIESVPDLQRWLAVHPGRGNPDAPLFPGRGGGALTAEVINDLLKRMSRKAGINKRVHPHLLRHTRATHLAKSLTEDQMRVYFGWTKSSEVPSRYVHLSGRDVDDALLKIYGMGDGQKGRACPRCGFLNPAGGLYCSRCSAVLSEVEALRVEERRRKEEEIVERVVRKILELNLEILERVMREMGGLEDLEGESSGYQNHISPST